MWKTILIFGVFIVKVVEALSQQTSGDHNPGLFRLLQDRRVDSSRVDLLLQASDFYFLKPHRSKTDLDTAYVHARSAEALSLKLNYQKGLANSYAQFSKILHRKNDSASGKHFVNSAIEIFKKGNYLVELGYAYYDLSGYYSFYGTDMVKRIHCVEMALEAFQKAGSRKKEADVFKELGDLRQIQGDDLQALSDLKTALKIYQSIAYPNLQGTYDLMGAISAKLGDFEKGLKYGLLALKTAEEMKDTTLQLATICNRIGITYEQMTKYEQAHIYWQKSLSIARKYNDNDAIIQLTCHLAHVLVELKRPKESLAILQRIVARPLSDMFLRMLVTSRFVMAYIELKDYNSATRYLDMLLDLSKTLDLNDPNQSFVYKAVIPFYIATGQYTAARKFLAMNEAYCIKRRSPVDLSKNHLWWFRLDSLQASYQTAIIHLQKYKHLGDSLLNEATSNQIEQLQIQFDTEKKDQDLILKEQNIQLLTKRGQLQNNELEQARFTKNVTLVVIGLLVIIVGLLIYHSQHRLKIQTQLEEQQKEIRNKNFSLQRLVEEKDWLVKEIHHRVKNNFHIVIGLLGTQSGYLKNEEAIAAIRDSQHRVHAMSLIHQKLYQSESLSAINMPDYIHELVDYLRDSFNIGYPLQFKLDIDRIELDLSRCIPLGLILNEAITNSIKYAFLPKKSGLISISLTRINEKDMQLKISDDGTGIPEGFDFSRRDTMGMNLMQGLCEDIGGKFNISSDHGTIVTVAFGHEV